MNYEDTTLLLSVRSGGDGEGSEDDDDDEYIIYSSVWTLMRKFMLPYVAVQLQGEGWEYTAVH